MVRLSVQDRRFTCCLCLHVRTGTILLGVAQIILHLICISVLILLAIKPDMFPSSGISIDKKHNFAVMNGEKVGSRSHALSIILHLVPGISDLQDSIALPPPLMDKSNTNSVAPDLNHDLNEKPADSNDPLSFEDTPAVKVNFFTPEDQSPTAKPRRHFSPYFALCLSTFSLAFCCFLVHGAVARQPTHLLPFFFLQVFDFIISLLTVVGYMSSTSGVRLWLHTKDGSMYINSMSLAFLLLSISCIVLAFKAYCLGMVWDCYKYLMLTYHSSDRSDSWPGERFGFLPTIWSFLGTGRRSNMYRNHLSSQRGADPSGDLEHSRPAPVVFDQSNDLPNYEDALKIPANAYAPPPYFCPTTKSATTAPKVDAENETAPKDAMVDSNRAPSA